jgi:hypothetical protein
MRKMDIIFRKKHRFVEKINHTLLICRSISRRLYLITSWVMISSLHDTEFKKSPGRDIGAYDAIGHCLADCDVDSHT